MSHTPNSFSSEATVADLHPMSASKPPAHPDSTNPIASKKLTLGKRPWRRYATPFDRIIQHRYQGSGTEEDPFLVDWLSDDVEDPQQWSVPYKWFVVITASWATLAVALSSSAYSGGQQSLIKEFGASSELVTGGLSLFVVGFAFGPLLWAPLSEVYGRRVVYWTTYVMLTLWTAVTAASQNIGSVLVFRALSGLFGASPLSNAGGTIADVMDANQRGLAMALFAAAPFLGPALGPITGGFLGQAAGWRWIEGFLAIFCGVMALILFLFSPETYAPKLLRERAERLSKHTGLVYRYRSDAKSMPKLATVLKVSLIRPWMFLIHEPIVIIMSLYTAIVYGTLYLNFSAYPIVFAVGHGFTAGEVGLAFLGILVGVLLAVAISATVINPMYLKTVKKRGYPTPEDRLPPVIAAGCLMVVALAGFAATCGPEIHWIAPIIFGIPFGLAMVLIFIGSLSYLVDTYSVYAASVLAANSVLRSLFGAAFPLFTTQMYKKLGVHWASAIPGFLGLICIPFTIAFYKYGAVIRSKCRYAADAQRQLQAIMAARMATNKHDEESQADGAVTAVTTQHEPEPAQEQEQGQAQGVGKEIKAEVQGVSTSEKTAGVGGEHAMPPHARGHPQHEWDEYGVLADRDMWDMNDEERLRLQDLHAKFGHVKAKKQ